MTGAHVFLSPDDREVVYSITYDTDGHVMTVETARDGHRSFYSFEWSRRFGAIYHWTGAGPFRSAVEPGRLVGGGLPCRIWVADGIKILGGGRWRKAKRPSKRRSGMVCVRKSHVIDARQLRRQGWVQLREPAENPFDDTIENESPYHCKVCDDYLPDDTADRCEHVAWCDDCERLVYVKLPSGVVLEPGRGYNVDEDPCPHLVTCSDCGPWNNRGPFADDHYEECHTTPLALPVSRVGTVADAGTEGRE